MLETEANFIANEKSRICPFNIVLLPGQCTRIAYDNYDWYVENLQVKILCTIPLVYCIKILKVTLRSSI